ncbi:hypothetical protein ACFE04_024507 [Oxalis oulophora]
MIRRFIFFNLLPLLLCLSSATALPLSTDSRWIVDENGVRVKLACINWVTHLEVVVAEGLSKQPVDDISNKILSMGFNCVRLTWPLYLVTNETLGSLTVRQSFQGLGLVEAIVGIQANNPSIIDLPLINAYQAVVSSLANNNVMIILDNHISKPGWCCSNFDGNGFFGDKYFDPDLWITGLTKIATMFNGVPNVIGMSLRNELRGPKQNVNDWYTYMQRGAEVVHSINPNILVILSGLSFDLDLSFISKRPLNLTFTKKIVFEAHWYGFSDGSAWVSGNPNEVCGRVADKMMRNSGFLLKQGYPLFISEFGGDQRGTNVNDNRYLNCFLGVAAEHDLDWALWALQGSYYLREGVVGLNEYYGTLDWNWCGVRNSSFLQKVSAIQSPYQGPGLSETDAYKVILHPSTGLCVVRKSMFGPLELGSCTKSEAWSYTSQKNILLKGGLLCVQTDEEGKPAKLSLFCSDSKSKWDIISDSKMHLSSKVSNGKTVCLDVDSNNTIITSSCKCLNRDNNCDPASQWFKLVDSTRRTTTTKSWSNSIMNSHGQELLPSAVIAM